MPPKPLEHRRNQIKHSLFILLASQLPSASLPALFLPQSVLCSLWPCHCPALCQPFSKVCWKVLEWSERLLARLQEFSSHFFPPLKLVCWRSCLQSPKTTAWCGNRLQYPFLLRSLPLASPAGSISVSTLAQLLSFSFLAAVGTTTSWCDSGWCLLCVDVLMYKKGLYFTNWPGGRAGKDPVLAFPISVSAPCSSLSLANLPAHLASWGRTWSWFQSGLSFLPSPLLCSSTWDVIDLSFGCFHSLVPLGSEISNLASDWLSPALWLWKSSYYVWFQYNKFV